MAMSGQNTITGAGTEERLATNQPCNVVEVKALATNTGYIYVGNNGDDTVSSSTGFELAAGESVTFVVKNLNQVWVDCTVNGEGVCWIVKA